MRIRIFFVTDWDTVIEQPQSGGQKILLQHIEILNRHGHDARLVLGGQKGRWLGRLNTYSEPEFAVSWSEFEEAVTDRDFVVLPAINAERFRKVPGKRKLLFVQNGSLLFDSTELLPTGRYPWLSSDLEGIICESEYDKRLLELLSPSCPVYRVFNSIDPDDFPIVPWERKENLIATAPLLPYKNPWHTKTAAHLVLSRSEAGVGISPRPEVKVIQGLAPHEVPRVLGRAKVLIFLSTSEGFGLLPAEAMLSGTVVIGYEGQAYQEFMPDDYLHPAGDFDSIVETIELVMGGDLPAEWHDTIQGAREVAQRYSPAAQEKSLLEVWGSIARNADTVGSQPNVSHAG